MQIMLNRGEEKGRLIRIEEPRYVIGRGSDCQLRPRSIEVSRHHAELKNIAGMWQEVEHFLVAEKQSDTQAIWVASQPFHGSSDPGTAIGLVAERGEHDRRRSPADAGARLCRAGVVYPRHLRAAFVLVQTGF